MYLINKQLRTEGLSFAQLRDLLTNYDQSSVINKDLSDATFHGVCPLNQAQANYIAFCLKRQLRFDKRQTELGAVIISHDCEISGLEHEVLIIRVNNPQLSIIQIQKVFFDQALSTGVIDSSARIGKAVKLGENVQIEPFVQIADGCEIADNAIILANSVLYPYCKIGKNSLIHANVTIREYTVCGKNVIVQSGSVIGGDGFGYLPDPEIGILTVPQTGNVILNDYVEIGANTCIDRGALGETTIGLGSKVDNNVQIGHNVTIGQYSLICGNVAIAGSAQIGSQVIIGGATAVQGHLKVSDGVRVGGGSVIRRSIKAKGDYAGDPIMPIKEWRKQYLKKSGR